MAASVPSTSGGGDSGSSSSSSSSSGGGSSSAEAATTSALENAVALVWSGAEGALRALVAVPGIPGLDTELALGLLSTGYRRVNEHACHAGCDVLDRVVAAAE